ncbi:UNVERIFIED_CONTAM: hypothetical protein Sangu_2918000 [Sesamum angustifolium]|uniref:Reverse transcriptase n=1 Tax=Sesamum angustifolium TaxID=2727405 RepID=A0AAW2IM44_9LAMI
MQCMKAGDQCPYVFFCKIDARRASKRVLQIIDDDGTTHMDPIEVISEFMSIYQRVLGSERRDQFLDLRFLRQWARYIITKEDSNTLLMPVTGSEVKMAFFNTIEDKSPGPDGFSSSLYKPAWPVVGEEIMSAILKFFNIGKLLK